MRRVNTTSDMKFWVLTDQELATRLHGLAHIPENEFTFGVRPVPPVYQAEIQDLSTKEF